MLPIRRPRGRKCVPCKEVGHLRRVGTIGIRNPELAAAGLLGKERKLLAIRRECRSRFQPRRGGDGDRRGGWTARMRNLQPQHIGVEVLSYVREPVAMPR